MTTSPLSRLESIRKAMLRPMVRKADWKESDHPRADDGTFGSGGGHASTGENKPESKPSEPAKETGKESGKKPDPKTDPDNPKNWQAQGVGGKKVNEKEDAHTVTKPNGEPVAFIVPGGEDDGSDKYVSAGSRQFSQEMQSHLGEVQADDADTWQRGLTTIQNDVASGKIKPDAAYKEVEKRIDAYYNQTEDELRHTDDIAEKNFDRAYGADAQGLLKDQRQAMSDAFSECIGKIDEASRAFDSHFDSLAASLEGVEQGSEEWNDVVAAHDEELAGLQEDMDSAIKSAHAELNDAIYAAHEEADALIEERDEEWETAATEGADELAELHDDDGEPNLDRLQEINDELEASGNPNRVHYDADSESYEVMHVDDLPPDEDDEKE